MFMKKILFAVALLVSGCSGGRDDYDASGSFAATEVIVSSMIPGEILRMDPDEGTRLSKGDLIAIMDSVQLCLQRQQLLQGIAGVEAARPSENAQLAPLLEQLAGLQKDRTRIENLVMEDVLPRKQLDDITTGIAMLEKQIAAHRNTITTSLAGADAQAASMRTQLEQIDEQLARCLIVSPIDGTVVAKYAHAGELTSQGRPLLKIADTGNMYLKAYLTSAQLAGVHLGQTVRVRADFGGGNMREYNGEVIWISDKSEFTPKNIVTSDDRANMVYAAKIAVRNDGYLKMGMYGQVKF